MGIEHSDSTEPKPEQPELPKESDPTDHPAFADMTDSARADLAAELREIRNHIDETLADMDNANAKVVADQETYTAKGEIAGGFRVSKGTADDPDSPMWVLTNKDTGDQFRIFDDKIVVDESTTVYDPLTELDDIQPDGQE